MEKAFDNVEWNELFTIIKRVGFEDNDRRVIYNMYKSQSILLKINEKEVKVKIGKGVKQGCIISLMLFNLYTEQAMKELKEVQMWGLIVTALKFAGGVAFCTETEKYLQNNLISFVRILKSKYGIQLNKKKIKVIIWSKTYPADST